MADVALEVPYGATLLINATVTQSGVAVNLAGKTLKFMAKREYSDADAAAIITLATSSGITHTDASNGIAQIVIGQTDTDDLDAANETRLKWELKLFDGAYGYRVAKGPLTVVPAVVRAAS